MTASTAGPGSGATLASEERVRAAFLFQVAQYVHWPDESFPTRRSPLRFCVLAQDDLLPVLKEVVAGKTISDRPIEVSRASRVEELSSCQVAYIGLSREKQLKDMLSQWSYPPVMLVGEAPSFAEFGGTVKLILESGRVSFEVNTSSAARSRLEFRSQLLRFARIVSDTLGGPR